MATKKEVSAPAPAPVPVVKVVSAPVPAPVPAVTEERVAALEAKVDDLIKKLAKQMKF